MNYSDMDGKQFSSAMKNIRNINEVLYNKVMTKYFGEYKNYDDPIVASWNDDPDDVWDAEAFVENYIEMYNLEDDSRYVWVEDTNHNKPSEEELEKMIL